MSSGDAVFRQIQSVARASAANSGAGAPTQEYLIRHTLESFLDRLTRTSHASDFVLKGGVLLKTPVRTGASPCVVSSCRHKPVNWSCAALCRVAWLRAAQRAHSSGVERLIADQEAGVQFPLGR